MAHRILVVEDDLLNRMFYQAVLESQGYAVDAVADGAEVLGAVDSFRPDLITMDMHLPHVAGLDLTIALRANPATRSIPILALTAYAGRHEEERIRAAGAGSYVAKPVSVTRLLTEVSQLLGE